MLLNKHTAALLPLLKSLILSRITSEKKLGVGNCFFGSCSSTVTMWFSGTIICPAGLITIMYYLFRFGSTRGNEK